jgi:hypothetical protein
MGRSAIRLPPEIWMDVLDILLLVPFDLDVDCSLPSLWDWIWEKGRDMAPDSYRHSERQRLTFARVCRSWKEFADLRANRVERITTALARSRRIEIEDVKVEHPTTNTRWEILIADLEDEKGHGTEHFRRMAQNIHLHQNIKRIDLEITGSHKIPDLMHILPAFDKLVCLAVGFDEASTSTLAPPPGLISLPNLKTLIFMAPSMSRHPHEMFEIPSLVNLVFTVTERAPPFKELLDPYHTTLKNLGIYWRFPRPPNTTRMFPGWDFFPNLVELVLSDWGAHNPIFPFPLPLTHPLEVVRIDQITWPMIDHLLPGREDPKVFKRNSIRKLHILALDWCMGVYEEPGGYHLLDVPELRQIHALVNQCAIMGIRLEDKSGFCLEGVGSVSGDRDGVLGFGGSESECSQS